MKHKKPRNNVRSTRSTHSVPSTLIVKDISPEQAKADLKVEDPTPEKAVAVLAPPEDTNQ